MGEGAEKKIGFWGVVSIGVGGMVGGGIFAVLGLAVQLAHGGTPLAFAIAGVVALLTSYSYAKLSVSFPSQGGTIIFLDRAFGCNLATGGLNVLLWMSYVVMLSLYAYAFGSYGSTFFPNLDQDIAKHALISLGIIIPTALNLLGAAAIGRAETVVVLIKMAILVLVMVMGLGRVEPARLAPGAWSPLISLVAGGMIIFVAYEGFELIANTAQDVKDPGRTLPRAYYSSVSLVTVLYIAIAVVTVGTLSLTQVMASRDYVLAEAARPFLGQFGFRLVAVAALLATFSAINATLYGAARLSYSIAAEGELPALLEKRVWHRPVSGLLITAFLALLLANLADLSSISTMGSAGFLLIFATVNAANYKLADQTGARRWLAATGCAACVAALGALLIRTADLAPSNLWFLAVLVGGSLIIEALYQRSSRRPWRLPHHHPNHGQQP